MISDNRVTKLYFNLLYVPIYDVSTACIASYLRLQRVCADKLGLRSRVAYGRRHWQQTQEHTHQTQ